MPPKKVTGKKTERDEEGAAPPKTVAAKGKKAPATTAGKAPPSPPAPKASNKKPVGSKKVADSDGSDGEDTAPPPATKGLKKESSGGTSNTLFVASACESLSQEEVEKGTVLFDYADALKTSRKVAGEEGGKRHSESLLKLISWNVAGLRAILKSGYAGSELEKLVKSERPDVLCIQETKLSELHQDTPLPTSEIEGYVFAESISVAKKGYAGTRTYFRKDAFEIEKCQHFFDFDLACSKGNNGSRTLGYTVQQGPLDAGVVSKAMDAEGRLVASVLLPKGAGSEPLLLLNTYVPNSGMKLERLDYRVMDFDVTMRTTLTDKATLTMAQYATSVLGQKSAPKADNMSIVWTGDLNVAERNYDRFHNGNFKGMQKVPGFTPAERASFRKTLETGFKDTFRELYPNHRGAYTFYSKMFNQRAKGNGWRLDYFIASTCAASRVVASAILNEYAASDHVPLVMWMKKK